MKTLKELETAINEGIPLIWNDPDFIEGYDYTITYMEDIQEDFDEYTPILIQYGGVSEAEVYLHEIIKKQ